MEEEPSRQPLTHPHVNALTTLSSELSSVPFHRSSKENLMASEVNNIAFDFQLLLNWVFRSPVTANHTFQKRGRKKPRSNRNISGSWMLNRNLNLIYNSFWKHKYSYHLEKMILAFKQAGSDVEIVCHALSHKQVSLSRKMNTFSMSSETANLGSTVGTLRLTCTSQFIFRELKCLHIKAQTALLLFGSVT